MKEAFETWTYGKRTFCGIRTTDGVAVIDKDGNYYGQISEDMKPWERIGWVAMTEPLEGQFEITIEPGRIITL